MSAWQAGQRAAIDRREIVTIDRVTPSGRAYVKGRVFNPDGKERTDSDYHAKLESLTPEIEADVILQRRASIASRAANAAIRDVDQWVGRAFSPWDPQRRATLNDIEKAERLAAAIKSVMDSAP